MNSICVKKQFLFLLLSFNVITWILGAYYIVTKSKTNQRDKWLDAAYQENSNQLQNQPKPIHNQLGEMGKPVTLPSNLTKEIRDKIEAGWKKHSYNQYVSDLISVQRSIPDVRDEWCTDPFKYEIILPKTSIIICFYNEAWSVLLRTVHSVLNRSSPHLIKEIILVDDCSDMDYLKQPLLDYWAGESKVKILRNKKREGLIRARLIGTAYATGEVLTFLDSHIEATPGWLEPLLERIRMNYTTVVCPVIDTIDSSTLEYNLGTEVFVGGFDWNLLFTWHKIPEREVKRRFHPADPVRTPTMAGGLFSINKKFFEELGFYDDGFEVWGAENLELSFKTWMCGGTLEIVPCSHIGHIFRETFPYTLSPNNLSHDSIRKNFLRLAEVWLDDYKIYHYERIGGSDLPIGDIRSRIQLRKNLDCQSFKWYVDNIYPELYVPENLRGYGLIGADGFCLDSWAKGGDIYQPISVNKCYLHSLGAGQFWYYSDKYEIRKDEYCIDYSGSNVNLYPCQGNSRSQMWIYNKETGGFYNTLSRKCLKISNDQSKVEVKDCDSNDPRQKWFIEILTY